jgi:hypothetical protein
VTPLWSKFWFWRHPLLPGTHQHLAERLTPYPLPTKGGGVLRTIGDARAYMLALSEDREWLDHWKAAYRLLVASAAELTQQVYVALSMAGLTAKRSTA